MAILLLSMPKSKNFSTALHQPISSIFASNTGPDFLLSATDKSRIINGMKVIVFDRPRQQWEGVVDKVVLSHNTTKNGTPRHHVLIHNLKPPTACTVPPNLVKRTGVGFM